MASSEKFLAANDFVIIYMLDTPINEEDPDFDGGVAYGKVMSVGPKVETDVSSGDTVVFETTDLPVSADNCYLIHESRVLGVSTNQRSPRRELLYEQADEIVAKLDRGTDLLGKIAKLNEEFAADKSYVNGRATLVKIIALTVACIETHDEQVWGKS